METGNHKKTNINTVFGKIQEIKLTRESQAQSKNTVSVILDSPYLNSIFISGLTLPPSLWPILSMDSTYITETYIMTNIRD